MELVLPQTGLMMAEVDAVLVVPGSGLGPGHTLDIPANIHSDIHSDNQSVISILVLVSLVRYVHSGPVLSA